MYLYKNGSCCCNCGGALYLEPGKFCKHMAALCFLLIERSEAMPGRFVEADLGLKLTAMLDEEILTEKTGEGTYEDPIVL